MASINYASKEISCKIVFYGPGLSGKTTNLQYVHRKIPPQTRGELISLATDQDRTLFFDFLPVDIGKVHGFSTKFQLYTVPGQVYYNATRKLVLRGVDGLVFVADSQKSKMDENIESLQNLMENLSEYGYKIERIPLVFQYNKRDLPDIRPVEELQKTLNPKGFSQFEAVATRGIGVFDTLKCVSKLVLDQAKRKQLFPEAEAVIQPAEKTAAGAELPQVSEREPVEAAAIPAGPMESSTPQAVATLAQKEVESSTEQEVPGREQVEPETAMKVELEMGEVTDQERPGTEKALPQESATIISWSAGKRKEKTQAKAFFLRRWLNKLFK
jgi:signal recognition particle receptor subunit beta